jgi:hypothetical protein
MPESFGPGVSRVLTALAQQFTTVVWQADKPPLDSELNLMSQVDWENLSQLVRAQVHSGFFLDPTRCEEDYIANPLNSNQFTLSPPALPDGNYENAPALYAAVNGWVIPITGAYMPELGGPDGVSNRVLLNPPPSTDSRTDFVFLEAWTALVSPNPSTINKPTASTVFKYGNTQYGGTNLGDQIEDPSVGFETTKRVQIQYRFRVVGSGDGLGTSVDLKTFPDGMTDPVVLAQGTAGTPQAGFPFANMRDELGDPSLWRAGNGVPSNVLGTVDGYVYAVPVCAVFRRNSTDFTAVAPGGTPNQNGGVTRTPSATSYLNARSLLQASLAADLPRTGATSIGWVQLTNYAASALDDPNLFPVGTTRRYLTIGEGIDREIIAIDQNVDPLTYPSHIFIDLSGRGRAGTQARRHPAGTKVSLYTNRPDSLYSDQIALTDILDMRRSVNFGDWDYTRLLQKGVAALIQNNLRTTFKTSGTGGDSAGPVTTEVSIFSNLLPTPNHTSPVDAPNGIRTVWSDSAALQSDITVVLNDQASLDGFHYTATTFDTLSAGVAWTVGADFKPNGFMNYGGAAVGWANGSVIFVDIGGVDGVSGAFYGSLNGQKNARFIAPYEVWKPGEVDLYSHQPWQLRFLGGVDGNLPASGTLNDRNAYRAGYVTTPALSASTAPYTGGVINHPGPMFPVASTNFERPFIVLGGLVRPELRFTGVLANNTNLVNAGGSQYEVNISSINWNTYANLLGRGQKTLRDYLTNDGADYTGLSSRLYLVLYGDPDNRDNNGAFQVIGAGTAAATGGQYTQNVSAAGVGRLVVRPLSADFASFVNGSKTVTIEFRSMEINLEDDAGSSNQPHGVAVVLTDLKAAGLPWGSVDVGYRLLETAGKLYPVPSKATLTMDLLWSPSHGASERVPDRLDRFGVRNPIASFARSPVSVQDTGFISDTGYPSGDVVYESTQVQLWNRLPSEGLSGPFAPAFGGAVVGLTEQDREAELFVDLGSKTAVFRPLTKKTLILKGLNIIDSWFESTLQPYPGGETPGSVPLFGPTNYRTSPPYNFPKDGHGLFASGITQAYVLPPEFVPRFGRQDIPYHFYTGPSDPIYPGINHLFLDQPGTSADVFYVIGGADNGGSAYVRSILFDTDAGDYGTATNTGGPAHTSYAARKTYLPEVVSSDLGEGMWGIELPPYLGIARLYGVYELNDFLARQDGTNVGAFLNNDRTALITGTGGTPPTNLLRTDATKQTLFIRKGGANDITQLSDSHTYLVPDSAIDITRIPTYVSGNAFNDFQYVVECVVFGFAEGFINKNNYVIAREHAGTGAIVTSVSNIELTSVDMVLPSPPPPGVQPYEVFDRTVYQGDPYMTRDGSTPQSADYGTRYGQIAQTSAVGLQTSVTPQSEVAVPNPRAVEVLATMDFYTTLGTGKMGGLLYPDTVTDCGITSPASFSSYGQRVPATSSDYTWRVIPSAFTAGQVGNETYARASVNIVDTPAFAAQQLTVTFTVSGVTVSLVAGVAVPGEFLVGGGNTPTATNLATAINLAVNGLTPYVQAVAVGPTVTVISRFPGAGGNAATISLTLGSPSGGVSVLSLATVQNAQSLPRTSTHFAGGVDYPANAGDGRSVISLTGMTERLPLGILVSDSDFAAENLLGDGSTSLRSYPGSLRAVYENVPLTSGGKEYTRFIGEPGTVLSMCDGAVLEYVPYTPATPSGTKKYRIYRGGGAGFVLSGAAPGGPITWVSDSFAASAQPVLKGAALACKAILVRNYREKAFGVSSVRTEGDEIQMVVLTQAVYGSPATTQDGVTLSGVISPSGYGQGYAAADRFLIPGRPMDRGRTRSTRDPDTLPAPYFPGT